MGGDSGGRDLHVAGHIFMGTDHRDASVGKARLSWWYSEQSIQVAGVGGLIVCSAGRSPSATMGLFWELNF